MMNSEASLESILDDLRPDALEATIDIPLAESLEKLEYHEEETATYSGFIELVTEISGTLIGSFFISESCALAKGKDWLNRHYGKSHEAGYHMAMLDYLDLSMRSVEQIKQAMLIGAQEEMRKARIKVSFASLDWRKRIELVHACKHRFAKTLPKELFERPDWCLVDDLPDLMNLFVCDSPDAYFRASSTP